jgi:hypothetical protein
MTTDEWLETFLASADAPAGLEVTCHPKDAWAPVPVGDTTGAFYLEPCGPLWAVVAAGDRGYVFTVSYSVMDTEVQSAPFVTTFKEMLAGMELTPETATKP